MNVWSKVTGPWLVYIKLAIIAILVALAVFLTRNYYAAMQDRMVQIAVGDAVREVNRAYSMERERRIAAEGEVKERYKELVKAIADIKVSNTIVQETIIKEVASNPQFYKQQLPKAGYEAWLKARKQAEATIESVQTVEAVKDKAEALNSAVDKAKP